MFHNLDLDHLRVGNYTLHTYYKTTALLISFDEIKDVCVPTVTDSDGKQICMYVCMLSITNLLVLPGGLFFWSVAKV